MDSDSLLFSKNHIWLLTQEGDTVKIGISDYAQRKLGSIIFINLPEKGEALFEGTCFGDVESIKTVSDMIAPVDGEVTRVNAALLDEPECINSAPYESWMLEVRVEILPDNLMNASAYAEYLEELS